MRFPSAPEGNGCGEWLPALLWWPSGSVWASVSARAIATPRQATGRWGCSEERDDMPRSAGAWIPDGLHQDPPLQSRNGAGRHDVRRDLRSGGQVVVRGHSQWLDADGRAGTPFRLGQRNDRTRLSEHLSGRRDDDNHAHRERRRSECWASHQQRGPAVEGLYRANAKRGIGRECHRCRHGGHASSRHGRGAVDRHGGEALHRGREAVRIQTTTSSRSATARGNGSRFRA